MNIPKRAPHPGKLSEFYKKLGIVFSRAKMSLFHACTQHKLFKLTRDMRKNLSQAGVIILSDILSFIENSNRTYILKVQKRDYFTISVYIFRSNSLWNSSYRSKSKSPFSRPSSHFQHHVCWSRLWPFHLPRSNMDWVKCWTLKMHSRKKHSKMARLLDLERSPSRASLMQDMIQVIIKELK